MTRDYITPPNFDVHHDAIDGAKPDPWGYSRLDRLDGLDTRGPAPRYRAAINIAPVRPIAHRATYSPPEPWSPILTVIVLLPTVVIMAAVVVLLIARLAVR